MAHLKDKQCHNMIRGHRLDGNWSVSEDQPAMAGLGEVLSCIGPTCGDTVNWSAAEKIYETAFPAD
ncbi:hypothetical protein ACIA5H_36605, partial [Nocardia sp. NPDC051900]|uniref:hypothetical protein n=1 Tax=Nocardia sp. NPDC051900 TaxID=3364326 RepID=UPI003787A64A